ncbi:glycosyltransferase 87 family protein [Actinotalea solisilvae]|uniref:glycosyltransferase 87 family protein n=1 Tax=Actinotalea solisilvae TaxID=2072922 RepID=UPI0018F12F75|nr:glycosyltransferase 87 family protein [Actinotalea solisilvae]
MTVQAPVEPSTVTSPGGSWLERELAALGARRPGLAAALRWLWAHPSAVLLTLAMVVPGALGAAIPDGDAGWFRRAGTSMLGDGVWDVFADPGLQIGPVYLLALGVLVTVVQALHLPLLFTVAGLQCVGLTALAQWTARRWARATGCTPRQGRAAEWAVALPLVLGGPLAESVGNGHPEEILLGLLLANAALLARRRGSLGVALLVGLATGVKLWGVLGAPMILMSRSWRDTVLRGTTVVLLAALAYGPFFLLGEVNTFEFRWGINATSTLGLIGSAWIGSDWVLRVIQGVGVGLAGAAASLRRGGTGLVAVVVVISVRLLLDPLRLSYYSGPLLTVALIWLWTVGTRRVATRARVALTATATPVVLLPYFLGPTAEGVAGTLLLVALPVALLVLERSPRPSRTAA